MTEHPADPVPAPPDLDPGTLASASFARARKGFEPSEVRVLLGRAADALRAWKERDDRLVRRLADLERRLDQSQELDEERITAVLGEETARIVAAARAAATEIRSKAEDEATRLVEEREAAATASAEVLTTESTELRDEARRLRDDAAAAAAATRSEAQEHADRVRAEASAEHERLLGEAASVLAERSAEAEAVAAGIREAAQIELDNARAEGERLRDEARLAADAEVERARGDGRAMVEEARQLRRQMLQDLAERRRIARSQIEAARVGRDRIVESLGAAGERVGQVIAELEATDEHARRAADAAAAAVDDDLDVVVAELETGLTLGGLSLIEGPRRSDDPADDTAVDDGPAEADQNVDDVEVEMATGSEVTGVVDVVADVELAAPGSPAADEPPSTRSASPGATVHDLFERIRAERDRPDEDDVGAVDDLSDEEDDGLDEDEAGDDRSGPESAADATEGLAPVVVLGQPTAEDADGDVHPASGGVPASGQGPASGERPAPAEASASEDVGPGVAAPAGVGAVAVASSALDRRDDLLVPVEKAMTRTLKRLVSDEQNEVLDRLRRLRRGRPELDTLLPGDTEVATFTAALDDEFVVAATAGVRFWDSESGDDGGHPAERLDHDVLAGGLEVRVEELLGLRRAHLQRALDHAESAGIDLAELGDHIRAAYREWRTQSVPQLAGDLATAGFALGEQAAAGPGTPWCWEPDHGGLPCSDAEDNALAGALECGAAFPTGDLVPPAHPGCRCILVPPRR